MRTAESASQLLKLPAAPDVAVALRKRLDRIVEQWDRAVEEAIPDADPLTSRQVRDSIPKVLEKIALALESAGPEVTEVLQEVGSAHGVARFQQHYRIDELLIEYRLLRRIVLAELNDATDGKLTILHGIAVDAGVDVALQRGVVVFVAHLREQLQSAATAESKYLTFLSHDLRNSLNTVMLTLDLLSRTLQMQPSLQREAEDLVAVQESIRHTIDGMDRLLQAERLRKDAVELKLGAVDLHDLAGQVIRNFEAQATFKKLRVENNVPPDAHAHSDRELVALTLQNLLGNAIKYSTKGTIRITAEDERGGWRVLVCDEGPGISPERVESLFQAFTRGETHGQPGMGLGLNIAAHAARILGGEVRVQSDLGKGSTFSFILPPANP